MSDTIQNTTDNKRIAKNTIYLYIRMFIVMGVNLLASRVILNCLGVEDFGIYNLVGGVVVLFSFLSSSLTNTTQRFLCVEIGNKRSERIVEVYSTSIVAFFFIGCIIVLLLELFGNLFIEYVLKIPTIRLGSAKIVFHASILTFFFSMMKLPLNAVVISFEKMSFYAYSSIVEAILKIGILLPLYFINSDKLILYGWLLTLLNFGLLIWYYIYVNCIIKLNLNKQSIRIPILKNMLMFTGWSLFSSISNIMTKQSYGFIYNIFFGVGLNAAIGIMNQVSNVVYSFVQNFQTAINPPLIKYYASMETEKLKSLLFNSSAYSFYLMGVISVPIIFNIDGLLSLWLGIVPEYTGGFCILTFIALMINTYGGPIWTVIQASGDIKKYQITICFFTILNIPTCFIILNCGGSTYLPMAIPIITNLLVLFAGIYITGKLIGLGFLQYIARISRSTIVVFLSIVVIYTINNYVITFSNVVLNTIFDMVIVCVIVCFIGLSTSQKKKILMSIRSKVLR